MYFKVYSVLILVPTILLTCSCNRTEDYGKPLYAELDVQGHRGCRGSLPENSIAGFLQALEWGVNTLEMDVVISRDLQVVVSHEPTMSHHICLDRLGDEIDQTAQFQFNIYQMDYREIMNYDCGSLTAPGFPDQQPAPGPKPLLKDVIKAVESRTEELGRAPVKYNIETKSRPEFDNIFHPDPARFVELVLTVVNEYDLAARTTIQSFDPRTLKEVKKQAANMSTALLVDNISSPLQNLIELGFEPAIYSPHHRLVTRSLVRYLHEKKIALIPWTVNDPDRMESCIEMGVDGIITDYPERLLEILGRSPSPG